MLLHDVMLASAGSPVVSEKEPSLGGGWRSRGEGRLGSDDIVAGRS